MSRMIRKFKFSDLNLAFRTRGNMREALIKFDANNNKLFEESEIARAMITILGEDENEVHYVVKNVFRYDRDGDNAVTHTEFVNFSVEQHFGEMAIQRLHRQGYYVNGAKRIMNLSEFSTTLDYCLQTINSKGTPADYQRLFNEVDLDQDGYISYQDYFIFLREYFGTQSEAFEEEEKGNTNPPPPTPPKVVRPPSPKIIDGNGETPQERFAKLIYTQFKVIVMERDRNKNLTLERNEVDDILSNVLKLNYTEQTQIEDRFFGNANSVKYDDFLRTVLVTYFSDISAKKNFRGENINESEFVELINRISHFVAVKPAEHILKACFKEGSRGSGLSLSDFSNLLRNIFENYRFDTRGLPNGRTKTYETTAPVKYY